MLNFKAEKNLVTIYTTQIYHQETLIFDLLVPSIESQGGDSDDAFLNEVSEIMVNWGKQELYNYSFISTYHLWEKQIAHIIRDQSGGKIPSPRGDFVKSVKNILNDNFQIDSIPGGIWDYLETSRIIVNAFKHGEGKSLDDLKKVLPEIIYKGESDTHHVVIEVKEKQVRDLIDSLKMFYGNLDKETKLDFKNWVRH